MGSSVYNKENWVRVRYLDVAAELNKPVFSLATGQTVVNHTRRAGSQLGQVQELTA